MPYIARYNGEKKAPRQVPKGEEATCPECGEVVTVRGPFTDGRARHFWHSKRAGGGGGGGGGGPCDAVGESEEHMKWKSFAADRLQHIFDENFLTCRMEMELEAPISQKEYRKADSILLFEDRDEQLGQGVVIEVQQKNESKDIAATTRDYIEQDLSVVWTDESDFLDDRCTLEEVDIRHRARDAARTHYINGADRFSEMDLHVRYLQKAVYPIFDEIRTGELDAAWEGHYTQHIESSVPVTLPEEYLIDLGTELYRQTDWDDTFKTPLSSETFIAEVGKSGAAGPVPFDTSNLSGVIPRVYWEKYKEEFLGWMFTHRKLVAEGLQAAPLNIQIPATIPPEAMLELSRRSGDHHETVTGACPHCRKRQERNYFGESLLSTTCRECGEQFVIYPEVRLCES